MPSQLVLRWDLLPVPMREPAHSSAHQVQAASGGGSASLASRASFVEPICAVDCTKFSDITARPGSDHARVTMSLNRYILLYLTRWS